MPLITDPHVESLRLRWAPSPFPWSPSAAQSRCRPSRTRLRSAGLTGCACLAGAWMLRILRGSAGRAGLPGLTGGAAPRTRAFSAEVLCCGNRARSASVTLTGGGRLPASERNGKCARSASATDIFARRCCGTPVCWLVRCGSPPGARWDRLTRCPSGYLALGRLGADGRSPSAGGTAAGDLPSRPHLDAARASSPAHWRPATWAAGRAATPAARRGPGTAPGPAARRGCWRARRSEARREPATGSRSTGW